MTEADWADVRRIYALGIATRNATFETDVPPADALDAKWIHGQRWVILLDVAFAGRGLGTTLLRHQVDAALEAGFWTLQTSIFPENQASLAIHHKAGFRDVGRRERIGDRPTEASSR